ncbi:MAG: SIR2 family protein [Pseudomonadota bacterium]|nr:SIR2 family protein [Pseudomonadota bacterium]
MYPRDPDLQELRDALGRRELVVVAGAGVTIAALGGALRALARGAPAALPAALRGHLPSPPNWEKLIEVAEGVLGIVARGSSYTRLIERAEGVERAAMVRSGTDFGDWWEAYHTLLAGQTPSGAGKARVPILHAIERLGVPVITTNYDDVIETYTGWESFTPQHPGDWWNRLRKGEPAVFHVHGHWKSRDTCALGYSSYFRLLERTSLQNLLRTQLRGRTLLFLGCGQTVEDPNVSRLVAALAEMDLDAAPERRTTLVALTRGSEDPQVPWPVFDRIFVHRDKHGFEPQFIEHLLDPAAPAAGYAVLATVQPPRLRAPTSPAEWGRARWQAGAWHATQGRGDLLWTVCGTMRYGVPWQLSTRLATVTGGPELPAAALHDVIVRRAGVSRVRPAAAGYRLSAVPLSSALECVAAILEAAAGNPPPAPSGWSRAPVDALRWSDQSGAVAVAGSWAERHLPPVMAGARVFLGTRPWDTALANATADKVPWAEALLHLTRARWYLSLPNPNLADAHEALVHAETIDRELHGHFRALTELRRGEWLRLRGLPGQARPHLQMAHSLSEQRHQDLRTAREAMLQLGLCDLDELWHLWQRTTAPGGFGTFLEGGSLLVWELRCRASRYLQEALPAAERGTVWPAILGLVALGESKPGPANPGLPGRLQFQWTLCWNSAAVPSPLPTQATVRRRDKVHP